MNSSLMHPRNPYRIPPDFKELALKFPEFRKHAKQKLSGKIEIDFKDAAAVRALSTVLLKRDFNLQVELPPDRLVPTLPLRLNYLLWVEDLLLFAKPSTEQIVRGIDIGTGACCIYPILAARMKGWHFTATEADETNHKCSLETIERNCLQTHVTIIKVTAESMLNGNIDTTQLYDFTMCNPPFFDSDNFVPKSRSDKRPLPMCPKSGGSASASEIAVKGGEVKFIEKLIKESQEVKSCVRLFTTMVGHKSSVAPIKALLQEAGASSWNETEFYQGRTTRWGLAWTFCDNIALANLPQIRPKNNGKGPPPLTYTVSRERWTSKGDFTVTSVLFKTVELLICLKMEFRKVKDKKDKKAVEFIARANTWSNQRRKLREGKRLLEQGSDQPQAKKAKIDSDTHVQQKERSFYLKGLILVEETGKDSISLQLQWIEGGLGRESMNQILQYMKNNLFEK
uniref:U6 small nuclear RNA (adenine-(43)-N(6))-methyltransferase n=1 Tax=Daphnia barbata TaxID=414587 RepID=A0A4Y7M0Q3_9CRUS|nr:EOG090X04JL [Daphnia barbata]